MSGPTVPTVPALIPAPLRERIARGPGIAAFDADGTLWTGDIANEFCCWMIERGKFEDRWEPFAALDEVDPGAAAVEMLTFYGGHSVEDIDACCREFWTARPREWIAEATSAVVEMHRHQWQVFVVSASPAPIVAPIVDHLPIQPLAFELEIQEGRYTGQPGGSLCVGPGKVQRIRDHGIDRLAVSAGNTDLDRPMIREAQDFWWAIHPDQPLRNEAEHKGWWISDPG